ncbi:MAG: alpha/beta hydrolase [Alphaproteobacteria bacterium]|nr:alpha/beta hydrolase [Alphaproteobacteria bacterium]MBO6628165.1 alpha/beta hydrolase [Alphaproteobacteria bacterium]
MTRSTGATAWKAAKYGGIGLLITLSLFLSVVGWLSLPTKAPPITGTSGAILANSIAEEERVMINGLSQWTLTRGHNRDAPILLVLHGGPGAGEFAWFRAYNSELERTFVVVHWDQRGAGKSFDPATPANTMTFENIVQDVDAMVDHLRTKFGRERIAILAHSWGTLLGTTYIARHPEKISGYIGAGQIADMRANEAASYDFTLSEAHRLSNKAAIDALTGIGRPPYGVEATLVQRKWLTHFGGGITHDGRSVAQLAWTALSVPEFNLLDLIALARSALFSMDHLWSEIGSLNLDQTYTRFEVPVFFLLGRFDHQTPSSLAAAYFEVLQAPDKALIYFEASAHSPPWEEPARFAEIMTRTVKPRLLPDGEK